MREMANRCQSRTDMLVAERWKEDEMTAPLRKVTWLGAVVPALGLLLSLSLAACGKTEEKAKQAGAAPPPPTVVVAEVLQKTVPIYSEFVARTDAKETGEIPARLGELRFGGLDTRGDCLRRLGGTQVGNMGLQQPGHQAVAATQNEEQDQREAQVERLRPAAQSAHGAAASGGSGTNT